MFSKKLTKNVAKILACALFASIVPLTTMQTVNGAGQTIVNWNDVKQQIDGFGASQACDVYGDQIYNHPKRDEIMDLLFSQDKGIGLSVLRCEVGSGLNMPTIEPQDGVFDFTASPSELWVINQAKLRGIDKIFSTVWSPPAWMKTTGKITNGGYLKSDCYQKYADYLAEYVNGYKTHHGIDIYGVSIANEPEYAATWQSCLWKPEMFTDFLANYLAPTFARKNVPAKVIVGEKGWWSEEMVVNALNNPASCQRLDIVASHQYNGTIAPFPVSQSKGKHIWQTEISDTGIYKNGIEDGLYWAKKIHTFMTQADLNAFMYWLGASYKTNNESLIRLYNDGSYVSAKRLYTMGAFSKFIKPGYVRIGATENPASGVSLSAYKNPTTGDFSIVMINDTNTNQVINITPENFSAGFITPYVTNEKENLAKYDDIDLMNGTYTVSAGAYSVTTLVGTNGTPVKPQEEWTVVDDLNDLKKVYSASKEWMLEGNNPYGGFDEDFSRARRTKLDKQELVYRFKNITDFTAQIYFHLGLQGLSFYSSTDGIAWTNLNYDQSKSLTTGGGWEKIKIDRNEPLPTNTNYIKVEFDKGGKEWDKHLGQIKFKCDNNFPAPYDTLDDWSKTFSHSPNWKLDTDKSTSFEGDTSRARRTTATTEQIVYKAPGESMIKDFTAKLFYFRTYSSPFHFYTSNDGETWTKIDTSFTGDIYTTDYWHRQYCTPVNQSLNSKYLKIEFGGTGMFEWAKQLAELYCDVM
ncbi:MAG: glycoside hydrolase [Oscillospiraceae bacterium]